MTRLEFYVKWGIPASFEMRDDLIATLAVELPATLPEESPAPAGPQKPKPKELAT